MASHITVIKLSVWCLTVVTKSLCRPTDTGLQNVVKLWYKFRCGV